MRELHPAIARARAAAALRASAPQMPPSGSAQTPPSKQYCPPAHVPATPARSPYVGTPYRSATIAAQRWLTGECFKGHSELPLRFSGQLAAPSASQR